MSMNKKRDFSIFLLKPDFNEKNALKEDHKLKKCCEATNLPENSSLYIMDNHPTPPWWKDYFKILEDITQSLKSAILFIPVEDRCFVLTFGHSRHNLKDTSYEYDFGLIVTLNCIDSEKLRSTDIVEPAIARRQRVQLPIVSNLTYFDFNTDSDIIKKLTGKVKDEYQKLFNNATGSDSLHISIKHRPDELCELCSELLKLYSAEHYKNTFPEIQNIRPIKDPEITEKLNGELLEAIKKKSDNLMLSIPKIIDYESIAKIGFKDAKKNTTDFDRDVSIDNYYTFLDNIEFDIDKISSIEILKSHRLELVDEKGNKIDSFNIFRCLLFDTQIEERHEKLNYHLCDSNWYCIETDYIRSMKESLDKYFYESELIDYDHNSEKHYNKDVATKDKNILCLDCENISPKKQTPVEPCDLYSIENQASIFYHVKKGTNSSRLSHHFNQGVNSVELLKAEEKARHKLKDIIKEKLGDESLKIDEYIKPIDENNYRVIYAIITSKDKDKKSDNLPLFSRISLKRNIRALEVMNVKVKCTYVRSLNNDIK